jgi:phosphoglycerate kinase
MDYRTLDDFDVDGKTVLLRVDINLPLNKETLEIEDDARIRRIMPTLRELLDRGARVVILAHQGRPGEWDFTPLDRHAQVMSDLLGEEVMHVEDVLGEKAAEAISSLPTGRALLLGNVRGVECEMKKAKVEEHAKSELVTGLAPMVDLYVNDAFAASHRAQCSLVGFPARLPSAAGRLMERELEALAKVFEEPSKPAIFVIGGAKYADAIEVVDRLVGRGLATWVILTGVCANFFLKARGVNLGEATENFMEGESVPGLLQSARRTLRERGDHIILPHDVAVDCGGRRMEMLVGDLPSEHPILDIGERSIDKFSRVLRGARTIFFSGPAGMIETEDFALGTKELLVATAHARAFSMIGGGHTVGMVNRLGLADQFSYISTGGGALETYLKGSPLPAVEALKASKR